METTFENEPRLCVSTRVTGSYEVRTPHCLTNLGFLLRVGLFIATPERGGRVRSEADGPAITGPGLPVGQTRPPNSMHHSTCRSVDHSFDLGNVTTKKPHALNVWLVDCQERMVSWFTQFRAM